MARIRMFSSLAGSWKGAGLFVWRMFGVLWTAPVRLATFVAEESLPWSELPLISEATKRISDQHRRIFLNGGGNPCKYKAPRQRLLQ